MNGARTTINGAVINEISPPEHAGDTTFDDYVRLAKAIKG
jgi:hypothetical protein